jgi:hypothetical protein
VLSKLEPTVPAHGVGLRLALFQGNGKAGTPESKALHDSGDAFASGTTWQGQRALRVSVCNWQTTEADCLVLTDTLIAAHRCFARQTLG